MPDAGGVSKALKAAHDLYLAGDREAAKAAFEAVLSAAPDSPEAHLAYAKALMRGDPLTAEAYFRRAIELDPDSVEARVQLGRWALNFGRLDEAEAALLSALETRPSHPAALSRMAVLRERQQDDAGADAYHQLAIQASPSKANPHRAYADFLARQAGVHLQRASELDASPGSAARADDGARWKASPQTIGEAAFAQAEIIDTKLLGAGEAAYRRPAIWPRRQNEFLDLDTLIRRYVTPGIAPAAPLINAKTKVATLGSCFAGYIGERLKARGIDTFQQRIVEDLNSTYANRHLLDWIVNGVQTSISAQLEDLYGSTRRGEFEQGFRTAQVLVFSLGVAPAYFDRETGEFVMSFGGRAEAMSLPRRCLFRTTRVAENTDNLRRIIGLLRTLNPEGHIVLTVSPVPISATFERESAVIADCVSKSVLRVAADEVLGDGLDRIYYWPSFEIVRWLGGHLTSSHMPAFAAEDGATRHVSLWLVDLIARLFLETFGDESVRNAGADHEADHAGNVLSGQRAGR